MGRYVGSARNGVWGTFGDLGVVCHEAVLSRGRGPGIHITPPPLLWEMCNRTSK